MKKHLLVKEVEEQAAKHSPSSQNNVLVDMEEQNVLVIGQNEDDLLQYQGIVCSHISIVCSYINSILIYP